MVIAPPLPGLNLMDCESCLPAMQLSLETSQPNNWGIWCYLDCQVDAKLST